MGMAQALRPAVEAFLYREARLIDEGQFDEWLTLFTEDAHYWCPSNRDDVDPEREVSIIYDDRVRLSDRVWRLQSGKAFAQQPPSRTCRLISNVEVLDGPNGRLVVHSKFVILEVRRGKQTVYGGQYEHHLVGADGDWRIALKKVGLVSNDLPQENLAFLV